MYSEYKDLLELAEEHSQYESYLARHISNVQKGYQWFKDNLPELLSEYNYIEESAYYGELDEIIEQHDRSKYNRTLDPDSYYELKCEYDAYASYFYGKEKTKEVEDAFNYAWLAHIHANPHHWQHWMLQNDEDGLKILDMPYVFIIEMILDHWSFSWASGNLYEIFSWYDIHKEGMLLSNKTRKTYEYILLKLKEKLDSIEIN